MSHRMGYIEQRMNTEHGFRCSIEAEQPTEWRSGGCAASFLAFSHHITAHHHSLPDGTAIEMAYKGVFFVREWLPHATNEDEDDDAYQMTMTTEGMGRGLEKRRTSVEGGIPGGRDYNQVVTPNIQTLTANDGGDGRAPLGIDGQRTDGLSAPNNSRLPIALEPHHPHFQQWGMQFKCCRTVIEPRPPPLLPPMSGLRSPLPPTTVSVDRGPVFAPKCTMPSPFSWYIVPSGIVEALGLIMLLCTKMGNPLLVHRIQLFLVPDGRGCPCRVFKWKQYSLQGCTILLRSVPAPLLDALLSSPF
ncbi:hypothetical protein EDD18DRAFT_1107344 [Armillaria luteobubalina]|uniref:Uncharacterized protein n=1 Tax=Armillaria luteobubalina TaxID=153913 RepID=A0AA39Q141_9AGAR|nr:hypothetical protein EDD18DRAFT_1107344 [Armillaria luteobubalina]